MFVSSQFPCFAAVLGCSIFVVLLDYPKFEDVSGSGGIAPCIFNHALGGDSHFFFGPFSFNIS